MKYFLLMISLMLVVFACSPKEKVINPVDKSEKLLIATNEEQVKLKVIELPSLKEINPDLLSGISTENINSPVENIKEFGGNFYLFIPGDYKILVIRKYDFSLLTTINFSSDQYQPIDVVFPNSTDAYIIHKNSIYISLLDITNFELARKITVGNPPHSIACTGNQILVTNFADNSISIVDSRDRKEVAKIETQPYPSFIGITQNGNSAVVVCSGLGKYDENEAKTAAYIQNFDIQKRELTFSYELGFAQIAAIDQIPQGLVITPKDWGFIPTQNNLLRIDVRSSDKVNLVTKRNFYFISHDSKNERLILLRENSDRSDVLFADDRTGEIGDYYSFPYKIKFVLPY